MIKWNNVNYALPPASGEYIGYNSAWRHQQEFLFYNKKKLAWWTRAEGRSYPTHWAEVEDARLPVQLSFEGL